MSKKIAFVFPGQGAQYPGMGHDFFSQFPEAKSVFEEADRVLGTPFSKLIFEGSKEELTQTNNSQLAIFITSIAILRVVEAQLPELTPTVCAGLSLGEYTALVAAKKLTFAEALPLVKARGMWMQTACENHPGTMMVVLGLELNVVEETLTPFEKVWVANLNCPGQIVIAGEVTEVEKVAALLKEKGARRVLPLDVSGAFHSGLMQEAQDQLKPLILASNLESSPIDVVLNVEGDYVTDLEKVRECMISQVTHPVKWQKGVEKMVEAGVDLYIEMGPGKTLAGMNKRIGVEAPILSIEKSEDLALLKEKQHATIEG